MDNSQPPSPSTHQSDALSVPTSIPLDMDAYKALENRALELHDSVLESIERLNQRLDQMHADVGESELVYASAVDRLNEDVSTCIQDTTFMIAVCDELEKDFGQVNQLSTMVKRLDQRLNVMLDSLLHQQRAIGAKS
ncbi:hypothetical protein BC940DRAFT_343753 [Gongronella butleri]|nr:hypothetical protein BC940DRAFT_343753 [Gongronella butleri]